MFDRRIKYRHLEAFLTIARLGSLKAASGDLNLTQPALSKTLKELETILDAPLMSRHRGGIQLTREGEILQEFGGQSLAALRRGLDGIRAQGTGSEALRVGVLPSVAARLMPRAVKQFLDWAPDTHLSVTDGTHTTLLATLKSGALDMVIGRLGLPEIMTGLSFTQLYLEHVVCVVRAGHPVLAHANPLAHIAEWPLLYPPEGSAIRPLLDRWCLAQGVGALPRRIDVVSDAFGRSYVRDSDALWFISEGVIAQDLEAGHLRVVPLDLRLTTGPVGLMTRPDATSSASQSLFTRAVRQTAQQLIRRGGPIS